MSPTSQLEGAVSVDAMDIVYEKVFRRKVFHARRGELSFR
jgi:hypothetical protein